MAPPTYVVLGGAGAQAPALACNDAGCLAVWIEARSGSYTVWGLRLRPEGAPQDRAGFLLTSQTLFAETAVVATDGSRFMVAWADSQSLYATRIDPDGSTTTEQLAMGGVDPSSRTGGIAIAYGDQGAPTTAIDLAELSVAVPVPVPSHVSTFMLCPRLLTKANRALDRGSARIRSRTNAPNRSLPTLFVVPLFYVLIAKDHRKEKAKREALENARDEVTVVTNGGAPAYGAE